VDVAQEDFWGLWNDASDLRRAARARGQRGRAGKRLLAISGHDGRLRRSAQDRIAEPTPVLADQSGTAIAVATRPPRRGLDQKLDAALRRDTEQTEAEQAAKLAHARIALAATPARKAHGEPDFVACGYAIDALQHQLEIKAELELADHHQ